MKREEMMYCTTLSAIVTALLASKIAGNSYKLCVLGFFVLCLVDFILGVLYLKATEKKIITRKNIALVLTFMAVVGVEITDWSAESSLVLKLSMLLLVMCTRKNIYHILHNIVPIK